MDASSFGPHSPVSSPSRLVHARSSGRTPICFDNLTGNSMVLYGSYCFMAEHFKRLELVASSSVETVGTFGPIRNNCKETSPNSRKPCLETIRAYDLNSSQIQTDFPLASFDSNVRHEAMSTNLGPAQQDKQESPALEGGFLLGIPPSSGSPRSQPYLLSSSTSNVTLTEDGFYRVSPLGTSRTTTPSPSFQDFSAQVISIPLSQTFSTLPTPSFAIPSPSPSCDLIGVTSAPSIPRSRRVFQFSPVRRKAQRATKLTPPKASSPRASERPHHIGPHVMPDPASCSPLASHSTIHARTSSPDTTLVGLCDPSSSFAYDRIMDGQSYNTLTWLKEKVKRIEVCIDQEGFRTVQPSFRLVGFSKVGRTLDPDCHCEVADFMPVRRESFFFHYSALDTQPIIRRLKVNGEDSRDYLSRHASLSLKSNGVYTVRGTESSAFLLTNFDTETSKLKWKFDYVVDDRRNKSTGNIIPGEKTLTPLTFSCSPLLLHPLQGKKIRLMHVVRKSVVGKLTPEKVEPPWVPVPLGRAPRLALTRAPLRAPPSSTTQTTFVAQSANSRLWKRHSRSRSHVLKSTIPKDLQAIVPGTPRGILPSTSGKENVSATRRRRRASSAGEKGPAQLDRRYPLQPLPANGQNVNTLGHHILPNSHLSAMLSSHANGFNF